MGNSSSSSLHQQAIAAALSSKWEEAVKLNQQIIDVEPESIDALNRMARAYFELGNLRKAKHFYEQSLEFDPYNQIASKFLKRIEAFSKRGVKFNPSDILANHSQVATELFIEEPGKTKHVTLLKVAEPQRLSLLISGEIVNLVPKNRVVVVTGSRGEYLGVIPDDLSMRLIKLIKGGNRYQALIKTVKTNSLSILIRELFRSSKFKNQPSFLESTNNSSSYSSDHIVVPVDEENEVDTDEEEAMG